MPAAELVAVAGRSRGKPASRPIHPSPDHVVATGKGLLQVSLRASSAVPDRDPMPPPELAADAPVALFTQPVEVALGIARRMDVDAARSHGVHRLLGETGRSVGLVRHSHEPLVRQVRLDRRLAAIRMVEANEIGLDPLEKPAGLQVCHDPLAHDQPVEPGVLAGILVIRAVRVEEVDHRQTIAHAGLVIVGVVAGRDLHHAGAKSWVDQEAVGNDRDLPTGQRQVDELADQMPVPRIVGMHGHGRVAEHRLRPGRGDVQHFSRRRACNRIFDRPEVTLGIFVVNLVVGHGGSELRVPVDQSLASKNFAGLEQVEKRATNRARAGFVQGKPRSLPVARAAHHAKLAQDALFVFVLPGPDPFHERCPAQVVPGFLFFFQKALLDDGLSCDARVVGPRHPQDFVSLHAPPADQDVLERVVEGMTQMERTGDVGRWDHDAIGLPAAGGVGVEIPFVQPELIPALLGVLGSILLGKVRENSSFRASSSRGRGLDRFGELH